MEIKVTSSVDKTSKFGKPYKSLEVFCENETRKVNVFSNALDFANIKQGYTINGTMSKNGDYWDISFAGAEKPRGGAGGAFKQAQIEKAQETKAGYIAKAQDNKEQSIKVASTMRMAVDLAIAEYRDKTILDTLDSAVLKWRKWCWENWEVSEKDYAPFKD